LIDSAREEEAAAIDGAGSYTVKEVIFNDCPEETECNEHEEEH